MNPRDIPMNSALRVIAGREGEQDTMLVRLEATGGDPAAFEATVKDVLKLKGAVEVVAPGALPKDGLVIEDTRTYD
jgi:phenylacetate-CoA ligase